MFLAVIKFSLIILLTGEMNTAMSAFAPMTGNLGYILSYLTLPVTSALWPRLFFDNVHVWTYSNKMVIHVIPLRMQLLVPFIELVAACTGGLNAFITAFCSVH